MIAWLMNSLVNWLANSLMIVSINKLFNFFINELVGEFITWTLPNILAPFLWIDCCFCLPWHNLWGLYYQCQLLLSHCSLFLLSYCFNLIIGRPIALCPFCWLIIVSCWELKWEKVRFHVSSLWKMKKIQYTHLFWPGNMLFFSHL